MPIDRAAWLSPFSRLPAWLCPNCLIGHLKFKSDKDTQGHETERSRKHAASQEYAPDYVEHRFSAIMHCDNTACREVVSVIGTREGFDDYRPEDGDDQWTERLHVEAVIPAPVPISIPTNVPASIRTPIEAAATLHWINPASAGNALRQAVERYLDFKGVKANEYKPNAQPGKKRRRMSLGERFADYEGRLKGDSTFLSAIRWLGNVASHEGDLDRDHVLTAFEMLDAIIQKQFVRHERTLTKKAKVIERSKGKAKPAQ